MNFARESVLDDDALDDEATHVTGGGDSGGGAADAEDDKGDEDGKVEVAFHVDHVIILPLPTRTLHNFQNNFS